MWRCEKWGARPKRRFSIERPHKGKGCRYTSHQSTSLWALLKLMSPHWFRLVSLLKARTRHFEKPSFLPGSPAVFSREVLGPHLEARPGPSGRVAEPFLRFQPQPKPTQNAWLPRTCNTNVLSSKALWVYHDRNPVLISGFGSVKNEQIACTASLLNHSPL